MSASSIELPLSGRPSLKVVSFDDDITYYVKIVEWPTNMTALYMAKDNAPISPTRPLNPYAPWMQGVGHLIIVDMVTDSRLSIELADNVLDCLADYNKWKAEYQHECLFPGSSGHLVESARHALLSTARRTKFRCEWQDEARDEAGSS